MAEYVRELTAKKPCKHSTCGEFECLLFLFACSGHGLSVDVKNLLTSDCHDYYCTIFHHRICLFYRSRGIAGVKISLTVLESM